MEKIGGVGAEPESVTGVESIGVSGGGGEGGGGGGGGGGEGVGRKV